MQLLENLKLIFWLCSPFYKRALRAMYTQDLKNEFRKIFLFAKIYFPNANEECLGGYEHLKGKLRQLFGVEVRETPLPESLMGVYYPGSLGEKKGLIFINTLFHPVFRLSTLGHELSHTIVENYFGQTHGHEEVRVLNRIAMFQEALSDKDEVYADSLQTVGTFPAPDLGQFIKVPQWVAYYRATKYLQKNYPELTRGIRFKRGMLLNIALLIHYVRLRLFLNEELGL